MAGGGDGGAGWVGRGGARVRWRLRLWWGGGGRYINVAGNDCGVSDIDETLINREFVSSGLNGTTDSRYCTFGV